jgi:hypothetical protein
MLAGLLMAVIVDAPLMAMAEWVIKSKRKWGKYNHGYCTGIGPNE